AQEALADARSRLGKDADELGEVRWMIEELRVSLFAQTLGTAKPVSLQRIMRTIDDAIERQS
ncbi:MAG: DUF3418 domain-containing protein, partial [Acidothermaceae bacterium]